MIEIKGLCRQYGDGTRIEYQDTVFETGKSYALLGASGCGKSTLLNLIAGVLSPSLGQVYIDGRDMTALSQKEKDRFRIEKIGYIYQDFKLIEDMTVEDNIRILEMERVDTSHLSDTLSALGISALRKKRVSRLSGGEKQRVAIARAMIKKPDIILADEPTGNLNFQIGEQVISLLLEASRGKTLIAVTHDERLKPRFDVSLDMNRIAVNREVREHA